MTIVYVVNKIDVFLVVILGYFINDEKVVPFEIIGMIIVFSAIMLISFNQPQASDIEDDSTDRRLLGIFFAVILAMCGSVSQVLTRSLKEVPA